MIVKTGFDEKIGVLKEVESHYENDSIKSAVDLVIKSRDEYELKVLVVGHFNAGKSSLINSFIERPELLEEDLGETTAIASELRYSDEDKIYSFDKEMKKEKYIEGKKYLPSEYDHISYYLNSRGLKEIDDFVIVDTPGFDTSREDHTRALASYLGYGVGFIMVIDVQKGGIDSQTLNYLYEISQYSKNIVVLINKCDKRIESEVAKVVEGVRFTLEQHGFNYPVFTISKYDTEIIDKITKIFSGINAQEEYDAALHRVFVSGAKSIMETLKAVSENQFLDTYEYEEIIRIQERNRDLAKKAFETKKKELIDNIDDDIEGVIQEVKAALRSRSDEAARAIENGSTEGLQAIIVDTIRPVLVESVKAFSIEKIFGISQSLKVHLGSNTSQEEKGLDEIVGDIGEKIKGLIQSGAFLSGEEPNPETDEEKPKDKKGSATTGIYTLVTAALSIVTGGTVTWVEAIIVLLPEILAGLKSLFGESNHSKIMKQYEETIIPQVTNSLWPSIKESFTSNIDTMISIFENEMSESLDSIMQLINDAKRKKQESENEYESFKKMIISDINEIESVWEAENERR